VWTTFIGSIAAQTVSVHAESGLPPARDFLTSAGFGGLAALLAAGVIAVAITVQARNTGKQRELQLDQLERHHGDLRADQQRDSALARSWRRLQWVVDTAGVEPASSQGVTLGLGPELACEILRGILRDADEFGDEALGHAATVHLSQLSLVLAEQGGSPLAPPVDAAPTATTTAKPKAPAAPVSPPADEGAQISARSRRRTS
jgi:hypothetical protein